MRLRGRRPGTARRVRGPRRRRLRFLRCGRGARGLECRPCRSLWLWFWSLRSLLMYLGRNGSGGFGAQLLELGALTARLLGAKLFKLGALVVG